MNCNKKEWISSSGKNLYLSKSEFEKSIHFISDINFEDEFDKEIHDTIKQIKSVADEHDLTFEQAASVVMFSAKDVRERLESIVYENFLAFIVAAIDFEIKKDD